MTTTNTLQPAIDHIEDANDAWADAQIEAIVPNQTAIRAFDASPDGERFRSITGMTMWDNLGANSLPATADED
jgi:hypothetical protein